ncbi:hypothetical protein HYR69_05500 [Candidatus Sumerlaeota bacterium]|nr:hypothetical protein [Candidatus Sumerlaeota bacterium]
MGFLDIFEKLINEHGSASILRDRLDLLRDQHQVEIDALTSERDKLKAERDQLRTRLQTAEREFERLTQENSTLRPSDELADQELAILKYLASQNFNPTADDITRAIEQNKVKTEYLIQKLDEGDLIGSSISMGGPVTYHLLQKGRAFLVKGGFV